MNDIPQIAWVQLWPLLLIGGLLLGISWLQKLKLEKALLLAYARSILQLLALAWVLDVVFKGKHPVWVFGLLTAMLAVAAQQVVERQKKFVSQLYPLVFLSMLAGLIVIGIPVIWGAIRPSPWFRAELVIPLMGMLIGNSLNGLSLGLERLQHELDHKKTGVELLMNLGQRPAIACRDVLGEAFKIAWTPTLNSLTVAGLVIIPGLMTGVVLAGVSPMKAIAYQLLIFYGIFGHLGVSSFCLFYGVLWRYFGYL